MSDDPEVEVEASPETVTWLTLRFRTPVGDPFEMADRVMHAIIKHVPDKLVGLSWDQYDLDEE